MNNKKIIIAGGGTAGHVHAGIAVADELNKKSLNKDKNLHTNTNILFVGTRRGMESKIVPKHKYKIKFILARGLKRENPLVLMLSLLLIPIAFLQSFFIVLLFRPTAILGVGGYASWSMIVVGRLLFVKTYILEQNKVIGFTNRMLLSFVNKVFVAFPNTEKIDKKYQNKVSLVGCPIIKKQIKDNRDKKYFNILVFGGSQGAYALNNAFVEATQKLNKLNKTIALNIFHQTGEYSYKIVNKNKKNIEFKYRIQKFINNMPEIYSQVDLVICRSGASSVFELIYYKKPSILIPLPSSADNHQLKNARFLNKNGIAELIEQKDLTPDALVAMIKNYYKILEKSDLNKKELSSKFKKLNYLVDNSAKLIAEELIAGELIAE